MSIKLTIFDKINIINIVMTLILSAIAVILAYNSYRISVTSLKISENTYLLSQKVDKINNTQAEIELRGSIFALFTTIDMQRQNDVEGKNLQKCIKTLYEMKSILESQMKNAYLAQDKEISNTWVELYGQVNFNIKFLEEAQKGNTIVSGVKGILSELENMTKNIFDKFLEHIRTTTTQNQR
jgi:hypothetical protein